MAPREPLLKPFDFSGWDYQMPELGVAEARAQSADGSAEYFASHGRSELAAEEREIAVWWRRLAHFPEPGATRLHDDCREEAEQAIDILLARAEKFEAPLYSLSMALGRLLSGLHALAAHGNKLAARVWANMIYESANDFEMLAFNKPEIFREWARSAIAVPGCISRNTEKQRNNQELLRKLEQGEDCHFAILPTGKPGRKWTFKDNANGLAARLWSYIDNSRTVYSFHAIQAKHAGRELPGWLQDAVQLEPFSAKTWQKWAEVAWKVLAEISPNGNPGRHPAFYETATKICNVRTHRKESYQTFTGKDVIHSSPSIAENDIKEALFGAFEVVATGISRRTKQQRQKGFPDN